MKNGYVQFLLGDYIEENEMISFIPKTVVLKNICKKQSDVSLIITSDKVSVEIELLNAVFNKDINNQAEWTLEQLKKTIQGENNCLIDYDNNHPGSHLQKVRIKFYVDDVENGQYVDFCTGELKIKFL